MRRINKIVVYVILLVGILPAWGRADPALIADKAQASVNQTYAGGFTLEDPLTFTNNPTLLTGYLFAPSVPSIFTNLPSGDIPYNIGGSGIGGGLSFLNAWAGDPVNMANGNLYHVERDISIPGRGGLPIVFERSYNSRTANTDTACAPMGCGWTHSFNHALKFYGVEGGAAKVSWIDGTGSEKFFSTTAHVSGNINLSTTLTNPPGVYGG